MLQHGAIEGGEYDATTTSAEIDEWQGAWGDGRREGKKGGKNMSITRALTQKS